MCLATQNFAHSSTDVNERAFLSRLARFLADVVVVVAVVAVVFVADADEKKKQQQ